MREFDIPVDLVIKSDAVAAIGIVKRQGLGRIRHLAVGDLWVQQRSKNKEVRYMKLEGSRNTSDILTKVVEREVIERHMSTMHMEYREGRHPDTPSYTGKEDSVPVGEAEEA